MCLRKHKIVAHFRALIVDWVREIITNFGVNEVSIFQAVNYMDRYLSATDKTIQKSDLHTVAIACMTLATKFNDSHTHVEIENACSTVPNSLYSKKQLGLLELEIFKTLNFDVDAVTTSEFIHIYSILLLDGRDKELIVYLALFFAQINLLDYKMCSIYTSLQAAACLYFAMKHLHNLSNTRRTKSNALSSLELLSGHSERKIYDTSKMTEFNCRFFNEKFPDMQYFQKRYSRILAHIFSKEFTI